jgi:uroporphyrinogen-III synthase
MRVLSLESRRAGQMEQMIRHHGGTPFVAPSVKEIPFEQHQDVYAWAERLFAGEFDLLILMTGTGLAFLRDILAERYPPERFRGALRATTLIARGPKPAAVLREMGIIPEVIVAEPNTWREIVHAVSPRAERRIAVQEYGQPNPDFIRALESLGAQMTTIAIYRWTLPDDLAPLEAAVRRIACREVDVVLFTTSIQLTHLLQVAASMGVEREVRRALAEDIAIGSVGPVMDAALADIGIQADIRPTHPKMAVLVRTAAENAAAVLARKRRIPAN